MSDKAEVTLFELVGGLPGIRRVTTRFYEKVYAHQWLRQFFLAVEQDHIARQQADFMSGMLGGAYIFVGQPPSHAHRHINITKEAFQLRQDLLREALSELGVAPTIANKWLKIDEAFRPLLLRTSAACKRQPGGPPIVRVPPMISNSKGCRRPNTLVVKRQR